MRARMTTGIVSVAVLLFSPLCAPGAEAGETKAVETGAAASETAKDQATAMSTEHEAMMQAWTKAATPGLEHAALAELAGTWTVTTKMWMDPSKPPDVGKGMANRTMILEGRVLEERFSGPGMGGPPFEGLGHTGYDNVTGRYWSTWTDNMMTGVAVLYGNPDDTGKTWVFEGEMPDAMAGKPIPMRIESHNDEAGREISEFYRPGRDGQMVKSMELVYERR